jgi:hypothetical protein
MPTIRGTVVREFEVTVALTMRLPVPPRSQPTTFVTQGSSRSYNHVQALVLVR